MDSLLYGLMLIQEFLNANNNPSIVIFNIYHRDVNYSLIKCESNETEFLFT